MTRTDTPSPDGPYLTATLVETRIAPQRTDLITVWNRSSIPALRRADDMGRPIKVRIFPLAPRPPTNVRTDT